uniref:Uncharacterized protein n=1 Tax=Lotharella globosa TaxID=91324 RepID=A0A7S3YZ45_9EUKA|mmetsp:Transcript_16974/g.32208  ORF Transcript_16974/g.32208 Transcript_16974/m.32208 type:complete len:105 (-) Transcript_16974:10-324(-)
MLGLFVGARGLHYPSVAARTASSDPHDGRSPAFLVTSPCHVPLAANSRERLRIFASLVFVFERASQALFPTPGRGQHIDEKGNEEDKKDAAGEARTRGQAPVHR